jgi:hypothetical protein
MKWVRPVTEVSQRLMAVFPAVPAEVVQETGRDRY